jgi:type I restriction enzyme M protein
MDYYEIDPNDWKFLENNTVKSYQQQAIKDPESNLEEYVRQWVIQELIDTYNYPIEQIDVEYSVRMGSSTRSADVVIFNKTIRKPFIFIETKRFDINDDIRQVESYMSAEITCLFGFWTNGVNDVFFQKIVASNEIIQVDSLPYYGKTGAEPIQTLIPKDRPQDFIRLLKTCHDILRTEENYHPDEAFDEMSKIFYAKIYDEMHPEKDFGYRFQRNLYGSEDELQSAVLALYEEHNKHSERRFFKDTIKIKPTTLYKITEKIESVSIFETNLDAKGVAFESFLGTTFRGQLGQYFTPRQIVEFMVGFSDLDDNKKILDPACGSGGFLLYALNFVRRKIDSERLSKGVADKRKFEFAHNNIHGIEVSPRLSRIAMMNMIISEDGYTNIRNEDALKSLEGYDSGIRGGHFDVILTNPPFGSKSTVKAPELVSNFILGSKENKRKSQKKDILFIERSLELLKPGGTLGIVLPDGVLGNPSSRFVRQFILRNAKLKAVISISEDAFKTAGAAVKSSLIFLEKKEEPNTDEDDYLIFMAEVEKIGFDATGRETDNELPPILEAFTQPQDEWDEFKKTKCRWLNINQIENLRFEAFYYNPIHEMLINELNALACDEIEVKPLSELGSFIPPLSKNDRDDVFENSNTKNYIAIADIDIDLGTIRETTNYNQDEIPKNAKKIVEKGDVIISTRRPTRGAIAVVGETDDKSFCTTFLEVFRPNNDISSDYIKYALRSRFSKLQFKRYAVFTSYPVISKDDIGKILIPIPKKIDKQMDTVKSSQQITSEVMKLKNEIISKYKTLETEVSNKLYESLDNNEDVLNQALGDI